MQPPLHRLNEFVPASPLAADLFTSWLSHRKVFRRHQNIRREGDPVSSVFFLVKGWVTSSVMMRDGRRQIVKVHLPGDMLGFPSLALEHAGEGLEALTGVELCSIPLAEIGRLFEELPSVAAALFLSTQKERIALMQELTWIGSTHALGRVAGFLLDLHERLDAAGLVEDGGFDFPLTQAHLGELLGLTGIHVNRTLKRLDATGCIERTRRRLRLIDLNGLRGLAPNHAPRYAGIEAWDRLGRPGAGAARPALRERAL
ncbi:Crp/Fnr family transcriptional regulator [Sphingomonas crocodyli]|uniref:Crp/Fnr family transcriptional regulator n=1 Tax=Sphingomonas crocodyli TaxID=1979270 RepID=A0A437LYF7_9SPHN|nr:Crp/Fnr family transcriptional regulator [Sphingomonas crocodyli]RVT90354.1 Crp/Fnr family transcriptional regulator [Sphingomonas crocodyli]